MIIFLKPFGEERLVKFVRILSLRIKSINPVQKYRHITESYACILKIFVKIVNLSVDLLKKCFITFATCSTPKL